MITKLLTSAFCAGIFSLGSISTASAALTGRLATTLGGTDYQAYYDDVLDVTWLANANLAASNTFGLAYNTDLGTHPGDTYAAYNAEIYTTGQMSWGGALHWIDAMNVDGGVGYLGINNWRLPTMMDTGTAGCNYSNTGGTDCGSNVLTGSAATTVYSEMASLWADTLGNLPIYDTAGNYGQPGWGLSNTGPFLNVQSDVYWTGVDDASLVTGAFAFDVFDGRQGSGDKYFEYRAWAVHSGDVATASVVPVPATAWLFGSGLLGLVGFARHKHA